MLGGIFLALYIITVACLSISLRTDPITVQLGLILLLTFTLPSLLARYGSELMIIAIATGVSLIFIQRWRMTHKKVPIIKFQLAALGIVLVIAIIAGVSAFRAVPVQETAGRQATFTRLTARILSLRISQDHQAAIISVQRLRSKESHHPKITRV